MWRIKVVVLVAFIIKTVGIAHGEVVIPEKDETISTFCECLTAFSGCESKLLASAAGYPLYSWYQTNYLKKGVQIDLNAACYRKRDVEGMGDGLCCTFPNNEAKTISNLFRGTRK
jgi:hypothetical protein